MRSDWLLRARAILNRQWDPIHLSRMPDADEWDWADEYDQYGDQLAGLIGECQTKDCSPIWSGPKWHGSA